MSPPLLAVALLALALPLPAHAQSAAPVVAHRERDSGRPRLHVALGLVLLDFARINAREETFDAEGIVLLTWSDTQLAKALAESPGGMLTLKPDEVRIPVLDFVNSIDLVKVKNEGVLHVRDDGTVTRRLRFSGKFSSQLDLHRFPFDHQNLHINILVADHPGDEVDLSVDDRNVARSEGAFVSDWEVGPAHAEIKTWYERAESRDRDLFVFRISIFRHSGSYHWRAMLPMTLLVVTSWLVFWFEPTNLQPQISTALAILLSLVTFSFAVDYQLPRMGYLTFLDQYALMSLIFVIAAIFGIAVVHALLVHQGVDKALRLQWWARRLFPAAYVLAVLGIVGTVLS
jgi:hypothetical protein